MTNDYNDHRSMRSMRYGPGPGDLEERGQLTKSIVRQFINDPEGGWKALAPTVDHQSSPAWNAFVGEMLTLVGVARNGADPQEEALWLGFLAGFSVGEESVSDALGVLASTLARRGRLALARMVMSRAMALCDETEGSWSRLLGDAVELATITQDRSFCDELCAAMPPEFAHAMAVRAERWLAKRGVT